MKVVKICVLEILCSQEAIAKYIKRSALSSSYEITRYEGIQPHLMVLQRRIQSQKF